MRCQIKFSHPQVIPVPRTRLVWCSCAGVPAPVEYWPSSRTDGFAWKSLSLRYEEKKSPNLYASSNGRICKQDRHRQTHGRNPQ